MFGLGQTSLKHSIFPHLFIFNIFHFIYFQSFHNPNKRPLSSMEKRKADKAQSALPHTKGKEKSTQPSRHSSFPQAGWEAKRTAAAVQFPHQTQPNFHFRQQIGGKAWKRSPRPTPFPHHKITSRESDGNGQRPFTARFQYAPRRLGDIKAKQKLKIISL